ncbi:hypothetical protein [Parvularcula lutaonensis]|uniref:Uncharacterized protein n=1 Tax=Parvularcula lutaonensis TaxID=491923 RepID=A0ABV7MBN6_9PROT|nr:hypothetical protein [Parvularcula lutaonensis]
MRGLVLRDAGPDRAKLLKKKGAAAEKMARKAKTEIAEHSKPKKTKPAKASRTLLSISHDNQLGLMHFRPSLASARFFTGGFPSFRDAPVPAPDKVTDGPDEASQLQASKLDAAPPSDAPKLETSPQSEALKPEAAPKSEAPKLEAQQTRDRTGLESEPSVSSTEARDVRANENGDSVKELLTRIDGLTNELAAMRAEFGALSSFRNSFFIRGTAALSLFEATYGVGGFNSTLAALYAEQYYARAGDNG